MFDNISRGGEVEFEYDGKQYSITHSEEGIHVMQFNNYSTEKVYKVPYEIIAYQINGKSLDTILSELTVTFRCFH